MSPRTGTGAENRSRLRQKLRHAQLARLCDRQLTDDGDVMLSQGATNGFIGGSVGAVGTVIATMVKKDQAREARMSPSPA